MSLYVWCEFVCSNCSKTAEGSHITGGRIPLEQMKKRARREGWQFTRNDAFCSRYCKDSFGGAS